ncbi:MAG: tyrosine--tRNA ligase [Candidatus Nanoarchaeia archaeon]
MDRFELIKRNTVEIVEEQELKELLKKKKNPSGYVGLACSGRVHIGYFIPMTKVADFLNAGFKFKILLADIHAHLDDQKTPFHLLDARVKYYKEAITGILESLGANTKNLEFVKGSDFELLPDYMLDVLKLSALTTFDRSKRAASEVVRFGENPKLSGFIYPLLQALDEQYLDVDVQYGGIDQRKILMYAREYLPKLDYKPRIEVMTPLLPSLTGEGKMSSSSSNKIDIIDSEQEVIRKMNGAFCPVGIVENNGVLAFVRYVIFPTKNKFIIKRDKKFGGDVTYKNYEDLEKDFVDKKLHPQDLKNSLAAEINLLLNPIRKIFEKNKKLIQEAYPSN